MKIKMLETMQAAPDGFTVLTYEAGETYDLPQSLADVFIQVKWAVAVKTHAPEHEELDRKYAGSAPQNKARK